MLWIRTGYVQNTNLTNYSCISSLDVKKNLSIWLPSSEIISTYFSNYVGRSVTLIGEGRKTIKWYVNVNATILHRRAIQTYMRRLMHGSTKPNLWSSYSLFRNNRGTSEFLKSTGKDRVITRADELLMQAWELNNDRKTEGGIYRKGQRQKTMKLKFEKNFCRQIKELATTNRWNYFDSSHIWVHARMDEIIQSWYHQKIYLGFSHLFRCGNLKTRHNKKWLRQTTKILVISQV